QLATGLAVLGVYLNLRESVLGPAFTTFDASWWAGRATDLALRIRRYGRLTYEAVEQFARLVALPPSDLVLWALPTMRQLGIVDYTTRPDGSIRVVEERVGVAAGVLEQCAAVWQRLGVRPVEAGAIASSDHAA